MPSWTGAAKSLTSSHRCVIINIRSSSSVNLVWPKSLVVLLIQQHMKVNGERGGYHGQFRHCPNYLISKGCKKANMHESEYQLVLKLSYRSVLNPKDHGHLKHLDIKVKVKE